MNQIALIWPYSWKEEILKKHQTRFMGVGDKLFKPAAKNNGTKFTWPYN